MPKLWVKNVNNLRKQKGKSCVYSSPTTLQKHYKYVVRIVKVVLTKQPLLQPSTAEHTPNQHGINLLNKSFTYFPQSLLINLKNEI